MALTPHAIRDFLEEELSFPIDAEEVTEQIGDVTVEAPDVEESETIADLLEGVGADHYDSADELNQQIHSMLPDEYIGRKYYDDRSGERTEGEVRGDEQDQSF